MKDTMKKSLATLLATVGMCTAFVGCGSTAYKGDKLDGTFDGTATVYSNGGFAVEQGDYVYFINGKDSYDKSNKYGEVVKAALMRIKKADLVAGKYDDVKTVVPSLFVAQNYDAGIYIYGDYVYYATPTTYNTMEGNVGNTNIDFKRAKLDGSKAPEDEFFRLSSNSAKYRFVEIDETVYCLYEDNSALKSYNTKTGDTTVLVSGAKSSFFYDLSDAENGSVYYTMNVKSSLNSEAASYDQLYCVRADATATVDAAKTSYTVSNGYTYEFNREEMEEANENGSSYVFSDYTTYPYVNLGTLVLDGVGKSTTKTQYTQDKQSTPIETAGYTYTITQYNDHGLYFTRKAVQSTGSQGENAKLYYVADATVQASDWNTITGNADANLDTVASNTAHTTSAIFNAVGDLQYYFYVENELLYRGGYDNSGNGEVIPTVQLTKKKIGAAKLWKLDKATEMLYYYTATDGGNGQTLSMIKYTGEMSDYNAILEDEEFQPVSVDYVDFNNKEDWYMPEIIGDTLLYANVQSFGDMSYNYIYAAKLGEVADVKERNESYKAVQDYMADSKYTDTVKSVMKYYFRTGATTLYDEVIDLYSASQKKAITEFVEQFGAGEQFENALESNFISLVGKVTQDDKQAMEEAFKTSLLTKTEEDTETGVDAWIIWTIVGVGAALIVGGVVAALLIVNAKKKAKKAEEDATVNAYKRKIDTTDDKTIDVYAEDETQTQTEETVEETTEETNE